MNKTELITGLRSHLADKEDIANEAAPALKLMRYALVELEKPTSGEVNNVEVNDLRRELAAAGRHTDQLNLDISDREGYIYALLADLGMVPEVEEEPVSSLREAIELVPSLLDDLQLKVASLYADNDADKDRFIGAVQQLLEVDASEGLMKLWNTLESKAQYLNSLETGIEQRDEEIKRHDWFTKKLTDLAGLEPDSQDFLQMRLTEWRDNRDRLQAIRGKLGIPAEAHGTVEELEIPAIDLLIQQRQDAQDRLSGNQQNQLIAQLNEILANTADAARMPPHRPMHSLADFVRQIVQERDVQLRDDANRMLREANRSCAPLEGWVSDAVDLAHAVRSNLAPENRVMAKAAEAIILRAPGVSDA